MANIPPLPPRPNRPNSSENPLVNQPHNKNQWSHSNVNGVNSHSVPSFNRPEANEIPQQKQHSPIYPQGVASHQSVNGYPTNHMQNTDNSNYLPPNNGNFNNPYAQTPKPPKKNNLILWISLGVVGLIIAVLSFTVFPRLIGFQPDPDKYPTGLEETDSPETSESKSETGIPEENRFVFNEHKTSDGKTLELYASNLDGKWSMYQEPKTEVANNSPSSSSIALVEVNNEVCRVQSQIFENPDDMPVSELLIKATAAAISTDDPTDMFPYSENLTVGAYFYPNVELSGNKGAATLAYFEELPDVYTVTIIYCEEPNNREALKTNMLDPQNDLGISYRTK